MQKLWELFITFFKIGGVTFGGGYAMLPMIQKEIAEKKKWATEEEIVDYYALGQCTPGIIAVNTATFIGYKQNGIAGAFFSTLGMITPSIIIITIIATFFDKFHQNNFVQAGLNGMKIGVIALIVHIVLRLWKKSVKNVFGYILAIISFLLLILINISPIFVIFFAAIAGIIYNIKTTRTNCND